MKLHLDNPSPRECCYDDNNIVVDYVEIDSIENRLGGEIILYHQLTCQVCKNEYECYWAQELYTPKDWCEKMDQLSD